MGAASAGSDQAAGLRRMNDPKPVKVIAVTSGKGGVGKTNLSVNLGTALAQGGRGVLLMDADLGLANVDVLLGLSPRRNLSHVIAGEATLEEIIVQATDGLSVIPAASGVQRMAELAPAEHAGLIRSFSELSQDIEYLIVDTAAGISDSVMSFARAAREVLVVVCDEPSSITDAYALIKVLNRDHRVQHFHIRGDDTVPRSGAGLCRRDPRGRRPAQVGAAPAPGGERLPREPLGTGVPGPGAAGGPVAAAGGRRGPPGVLRGTGDPVSG